MITEESAPGTHGIEMLDKTKENYIGFVIDGPREARTLSIYSHPLTHLNQNGTSDSDPSV